MSALTLCINVRLQLQRLASTVENDSNPDFEQELMRLSVLVNELETLLEKGSDSERQTEIVNSLCPKCRSFTVEKDNPHTCFDCRHTVTNMNHRIYFLFDK